MKGFLYRDLCAVKRISKFTAIILVCFAAMAFIRKPYSMQLLFPIYCVMMYVNQLMQEDEQNGWMAFVSAVPDGRQDMVRSKYAVMLLTAGAALFFELLLAVVLAAMGKQDLIFSVQIGLVAVGFAMLVAEVSLPLEYTFGYRDGAFLTIMAAALLLFVTGRIAYKGMQACDWELRGLNFLALVPAAAVIALRPSYRASLSAVRRRDF